MRRSYCISGTSLAKFKRKLDSLPKDVEPLDLIKPMGDVSFIKYGKFKIRRWRDNHVTRYDVGIK